MKRLTENQQAVYDYLVNFTVEHFYQPSVTEMAEHFGCCRNNVWLHLEALQRKGKVRLSRGKNRAIQILDERPCLRETSEVADA